MDKLTTTTEEKKPENKHFWLELLLYLLGGFGLFTAASVILGLFIDLESTWTILWVALVNLVFIGGSAIYLGVLRKKTSFEEMGLFPVVYKLRWFILAFIASVGLMPLRSIIGLLTSVIFEGGLESIQNRSEILLGGTMDLEPLAVIISFISIGIIVPISEELFFRGLIHRHFRKKFSMWPSILFSSLLFGLGHFDSIGVVVSSFIMGVVIAWAYEKTESLWVPISIHVITNSVAAILMYVLLYLQQVMELPI